MYQATKALKASASKRFNSRRVEDFIGWLIRRAFFFRVAEIEELQRNLKKLIDLFSTGFARGQHCVEIEVRKSSIGHARRKKFAQAAGIDGSQRADFFEDHTLQRLFKDTGIEQLANLGARPALDQHRAKKAQRVFLKLESGV